MPDNDRRGPGNGTDVLDRTQARTSTRKPPLYKVLLHNDDYTPAELVMHVLQKVFLMDAAKAFDVMHTAHVTGLCLCGTYPRDAAETLVQRAMDLARGHDFALQFTLEKE